MLKILKHRASGGVLTECFVQWQGYRVSEASWEPVAQANNLNTELVQEYATRKGLALPEGLDLEISDYSDSDVFTDGDNDEVAGPDAVADQESGHASDEALLAAQISGDIHAAGADEEGEEGEDGNAKEDEENEDGNAEGDEDEGERVYLNDNELDDVNDLISQVVG